MGDLLIYLNGKFVPKRDAMVSVFDHGLLYGDGIFEGIKSWDGKIFKLAEHIDRFYDSAHFLEIELKQTRQEMCEIVSDSVAVNGLHQGIAYIRLVATRGVGDLGLNPRKVKEDPTVYCIASSIQLYPEALYQNGLKVITCNTRRNSVQSLPARVKSLNYLNNVLGLIEVNRAGADEGVMLTQEGFVGECTADNIFFAKNGKICTPAPFHGILQGITRDSIIDLARRDGFEVEEGTYLTFDLITADECWLTGTGADLIPVVDIDSRNIGSGKPGPIFTGLRAKWRAYIDEPAHHTVIPAQSAVLAKYGMAAAG
jgi:branched-chain amino acid aminotransferase